MKDKSFRLEIGILALSAAKSSFDNTRIIKRAYVAGVIQDNDYFWEIWKQHNLIVNRLFPSCNNKSKQDDTLLIRDMTKTICRKEGSSTIVLVAGDADYGPPLEFTIEERWRVEVLTTGCGVSSALEKYAHELRVVNEDTIRRM